MDRRAPLPARPQLLHGPARPRSAAARLLHRLHDVRRSRRDHERRPLRAALLRAAVRDERRLCRVRRGRCGRRDRARPRCGRDRAGGGRRDPRRRTRHPHTRRARHGRGRLRPDHRRRAVPDHHRRRRSGRIPRREAQPAPARQARRARNRRGIHGDHTARLRPAPPLRKDARDLARPRRHPAAGGRLRRPAHRLLHPGRADHLRRRVCGAPVRCQRGRQPLRLADLEGHGRRPRPRRIHTRAADHGQHLRRLRRRLQRRRRARLGTRRRHHRHPLHLRPLVRLHHQRRTDHRPRPPHRLASPTPSTASPSPSSA